MSALVDARVRLVPFDAAAAEASAAHFTDADPKLLDLVKGAGGNSPYLARLIDRYHDWLSEVASKEVASVVDALCAVPDDETMKSVSQALRELKSKAALIIALADLGEIAELSEVTAWVTRVADAAVDRALKAVLHDAYERKRLPFLQSSDDASITVLAMGKHGAQELNYSSDIDLIVLFDDGELDKEAYFAQRKAYIAVTKSLVQLLSEQTADGYVFRTDLRLRPDPSVTPVCLGMDAAERYYESMGRTWERAAFIKARVIAGDMSKGAAFLKRLHPFVWRRHLDFAAVKDAQDMVDKIRDHKGLKGPISYSGHDMKLGRGGIREIEFFAQTHQLIFGGRDESLRQPKTCDALDALAKAGRITNKQSSVLKDAYREHRRIEHRLQMIDDAQTHSIPKHKDQLERFALFAGFDSSTACEAAIIARLEAVHEATKPEQAETSKEDELASEAITHFERWRNLPAFRSPRAGELLEDLAPKLSRAIAQTDHPGQTWQGLDTFISTLPAGIQIFSLLSQNDHLLDLLVEICGSAPDLAEYLGKNASVFDAVLDADFFRFLPDAQTYQDRLRSNIRSMDDYEWFLDDVRRWKKEEHFRVGVHLLRGLSSIGQIERAYSDIADACLMQVLPVVENSMRARFGPAPGSGFAIIAMGKLGSRQMTASSDIDMLFVFDADVDAETSGEKQIPAKSYFAKFTQRLISALTSPTSEGVVYEVDMRLRPSGKKGPVATSLASFAAYQANDAWTWEHLALSRARVLSPTQATASKIDAAIAKALRAARDRKQVISDTSTMRGKLAQALQSDDETIWQIKKGRGRMLDIELCVQAGLVVHKTRSAPRFEDNFNKLNSLAWFNAEQSETLCAAYHLFGTVQHCLRLVGRSSNPHESGDLRRFLSRTVGMDDISALETRLGENMRLSGDMIDEILQR